MSIKGWIRRNIESIKVILMLPFLPALYLLYRIKPVLIGFLLGILYFLAYNTPMYLNIHPILYLFSAWMIIGCLVFVYEVGKHERNR